MGLLKLLDFRDELDVTFGERNIESPTYNRWINFGYLDLCTSVDFDIFDDEVTVPTSNGVRSYTGPTSPFLFIKHIRDNTSEEGLSFIPKEDFFRLPISDTDAPKRWTLHQSKIWLYPTPNAAYSLKVIFKETPDPLEEDDDPTVLHAGWDAAVSMLSTHYGYMALGEENRGIAWYNRAVSYIQTRMTEGDIKRGPGLLSAFNMGDRDGTPNS